MPNDTINRAIKRASGEAGDVEFERIVYEGYGISGVAVMVECLTDNKNRTAANVRHGFSKYGGNMGTSGCVNYLFDKKGQIVLENTSDIDEDELMLLALEAGAEDIDVDEEGIEVITEPDNFSQVYQALLDQGYEILSGEVAQIPQTTVSLSEEESKEMEKMLEHLEEDDDVQNVYHNWEMED